MTKALNELAGRSPKDSDNEIRGAIEQLLTHQNESVRAAADKALQQWSDVYKHKQEINRKYKGPGFVGPSNKVVADSTNLYVGQILLASWAGAWYAAKITALQADGKVTVKYRGWGDRTDVIARAQLQLAHDGVEQPNKPPSSESGDENPFEPQEISKVRIWKDKSGKYTIEAEFLALTNGNVKLKNKKDGRETTVPLSKLSDAEQAVAKQLGQK